jgi:phosphate transport system permease protein
MSESLNNAPNTSAKNLAASTAYQKWRLVKDTLARNFVIVGGLSIILAIVLIFFYLLYVVLPLFASAKTSPIAEYSVPEPSLGNTVLIETEEQNEVAVRFTDSGNIIFFETATGKTLLKQALKIPEGVHITSFAQSSLISTGGIAYGLSDGKAIIFKLKYQETFPNNKRKVTPSIEFPLGEQPLVIDESGAPLEKLAVNMEDGQTIIAAKALDKVHLVSYIKEQALFADEATTTKTAAILENIPQKSLAKILIDKDGNQLYLIDNDGLLSANDIRDITLPKLKHQQNVIEAGQTVTSLTFLNGDISLLVGDSSGTVAQWTQIKNKLNRLSFKKIREFQVSDRAIVEIESEQRRKGFMAVDDNGSIGLYNTTAERQLIKERISESPPVAAALSPRSNRMLLETGNSKIHFWAIDNEHPEVSIKSLWQKIWYESYQKPDYIWQSSSASNDFEPKYSLVPLVFGTLKAAFYAMLVAMPLALLGAIYTAYFMAPQMRQIVKPAIELMGALPTVILGFLAGLWLAPFVEKNLAGLFLSLISIPIAVMLFAFCWQFLPKNLRQKIPEGWEAAILIPVIVFIGWFAFVISSPLEALLFNGSLRDWLSHEFGIGYDQRNALIVGIAMGFAVIPTIFSIAEDAIFSVPKHLTVGSLALGATTWQTMIKVVLLTASPGIFSAIMIGLGRAVGETMIVLMATGNTPVMDFSIFQGLRTLAANVAVEMPESEVDSTHYRVLFLTALVLFIFTFVFNTLAEIIRQRLREKYSSL